MADATSMRALSAALDAWPQRRPASARVLASRIRWAGGWQGAGPLSVRSLNRTMAARSTIAALRKIGANDPPRGVREAYARLGFPLGGGTTRLPPGPISLRAIARRLRGPGAVKLTALSYNTYLLPGLQIPFGRWIDEAVGWDALAWFGVPLGGALLVKFGLNSIPGIAIAEILGAAGITPTRAIKVATGLDLDQVVSIQAKPALQQRSEALGPTLAAYDLCCLCEVFTADTRETILSKLRLASSRRPYDDRAGPGEGGAGILAGSGLFFLARRRWPIVQTERMVFADRGNRLKDSDAWANKGVLLDVVDVGPGRIELYQTHLYYGGGIGVAGEPTSEERLAVWRAELDELARFYREHHRGENVAIVTGDFNIGAGDVRLYAEIRNRMDGLGLRDIWAWDVFGHGPSEGHTCRYTDGDSGQWQRSFGGEPVGAVWSGVCRPAAQAGIPGRRSETCDGAAMHVPPPSGVGRFDYLFVSHPVATQRLRVEVSRVIRRPFPLFPGAPSRSVEGEHYLSDHLGLEVDLFCSPAA